MDAQLAAAFSGVPFTTSGGTDITADVWAEEALEWSAGKDAARQFRPSQVNVLTLTFNNFTEKFSPGNTLSPYYPSFKPPLGLQLSSVAGSGGSLELESSGSLDLESGGTLDLEALPGRILFTGRLDSASYDVQFGHRVVAVSIKDLLSRLVNNIVSTPLYENVTIDQAIGYVLDAAGWSASARLLDVSTITLPQFWLDKEDAYAAIGKLVNTEGAAAYFYIDGPGNLVFKNHMARMTDVRSTVSQATYSTLDNIQLFNYDDNWQDVVVAAKVTQVVRAAQALGVLWSYGSDALVLAANETRTFEVRGNDPFTNIQEPSPVGTNAIQTLRPTATLTSGTFTITFKGQTTTALNWNDSYSAIQSALEALSTIGVGNVIVGGSLATALTIEFRGALKEAEQELVTVQSSLNVTTSVAKVKVSRAFDETTGNIIDTFFPTDTLTAGSFQVRYGSNTSPVILFNVNSATFKTRLVAGGFFSSGDLTDSGGPINTSDTVMTISGGLTFPPPDAQIVNSTVSGSRSTATLLVETTVRGSGPDYVSDFPVTFAFSEINAASAMLEVTAGASGATVNPLQVRAQLVSVVRSQDVTYPMDLTGVDDRQIFTPDIRPEIPLDDAENLVLDAYTHYSTNRPTIELTTVMDRNSGRVDSELEREVGDRVTIVDPHLGISTDYFIERRTFRLDATANLFTATYLLEAA